ncbi:hypothetical protein GDO78_014893 [Eleutherodactylus coqui]|uniref:Uncharacterized protein n=1 Tax=Eleutherodactylus coqui TaxID=57060 RepID=A0A8J6JPM7_ELECQ|nr:hypothetical protein GDO78_014893 [Eleutherodactylus coqui]
MADKDGIKPCEEEVEDETDLNYKAPEKKSLQEIQELDKDDESLIKYKQALLGSLPATVDPSVSNVQVIKMALICEEAPGPITMDLTGNVTALKDVAFVLKEGMLYKILICFKETHMVGSYGPRAEPYEFFTPAEEAPKGMLVRGGYHMKSLFTDDDKCEHLAWEWNLNIKKEWKE